MRAQSPIPVIVMASIAPVLTLMALVIDDERFPIAALRPTELPDTTAALAVTLGPILCAVTNDRMRAFRLAAAFLATLTIAAGTLASAAVCRGLYPPSFDVQRLIVFSLVTSLAAAGIVLGARSSGMRPGCATAAIMALYALPPFFFYITAELASAPVVFLKNASPMWAYLGNEAVSAGFAMLGGAGWSVALFHEWRLCRRAWRRHAR
ncbi:MAG: hypothetical protein L6Q71_06535 [Planctomycetes bacterium]|nr:hypothetical protein [Planctomycetota bacterium]NUQ34537.1 hypothetical protein [Planctomycetaceae bacterium]